jgi:hypothetical protein
MITLRLRLLHPLLASLCLATAQAMAATYAAKASHGWIVDATTRVPLPGVVVVAQWALEFGMEGGSAYSWVVRETVTGPDGRFDLAAWGPMPTPAFLPSEARLKGRDPRIVHFKDGYAGTQVSQSQADKAYTRAREYPTTGPAVREWYLNGETISYRSATGDPDRAAAEVQSFDLFLRSLHGSACLYLDIPQALQALRNARERLQAESPKASERFRYGRPAYDRWLIGGAAAEAEQKRACGTTAREALEKALR